jgi:Lipocalin-like domain
MFSSQLHRKKIFVSIVFMFILSACGSTVDSPDPQTIIVGKQWKVASRIENNGPAGLPDCAKDDTLELKAGGSFNSLIGKTQCNPSETDVINGQYQFSADKKRITFNANGFEYQGKIIEAFDNRVVIEFDLGPGFLIRDTFVPKG